MMTRTQFEKFLLSVGAFTLAAIPALGQAQKETPPAGGPAKAFTIPAHETYALPNGMKVTLVPYGNIPKVSVEVTLRTGSVNEPAELRGIADLTTDLLKEGTTSLNAQALAEATARMGSSLGAGADSDETSLQLDVLSENGAEAVKLLAEVLQHPLFPESELARLKTDAMRQITLAKSQPGTIAAERFSKLLYGDHPYGSVIPTEENINKIYIEDIKKFYAANYGATRSHIYVAGKFDTAAVKKAIADNFSGWTKGPAIVENLPKPKSQRVLDVTDRPGAPQSTITVGLPIPGSTSPDNIGLLVTNSLLGGSFASRITANIREQKGYTYSPHSVISRRYHDAYWAEVADVTTAVTGPSLKEIFGEIDRLQKEAPPAMELQGIQSYLSGIFVVQNSTRQALIGQLQYADLQGLGEDYLKTYVQKINAVTPADVQRIAKQYLKPEDMAIVVVGDKAQITEQLAPFASATPASK